MSPLLLTLAFSSAPLTLYVPPIRSLNHFIETVEDLLRESKVYTVRHYPRARIIWSKIRDSMSFAA